MSDQDELQDLMAWAAKNEPQHMADASASMKWYLAVDGDALQPLTTIIDQVVGEIEVWETERIVEPRRKKRAHVANARFKLAVRLLVLNMLYIHTLKSAHYSLAVLLDANRYAPKKRYGVKGLTYDAFLAAYKGLEALDYLEVTHNGFYDHQAKGGWSTRIKPTNRLLELCQSKIDLEDVRFVMRVPKDRRDEVIILRDGDKQDKDYKDTAIIKRMRSRLERINALLAKTSITLDLDEIEYNKLAKQMNNKFIATETGLDEALAYLKNTRLYRIFSDDSFERGGRFYRGWWMGIPKGYRSRILINGQPTVELDFSRYHISMLYAQLGEALASDPYDLLPNAPDRGRAVQIVKVTLNALLNAKGPINPVEEYHQDSVGMGWDELVALIMDGHPKLKEGGYFLNGYGLRLQYEDACIAEAIMLHFQKQGIPCLPVHDSFIVVSAYEEELMKVMLSSYKDRFGLDIGVKKG